MPRAYDVFGRSVYELPEDTTNSPHDGIYTHLRPLEDRLRIAALPPIDKTGWLACEWCGWLEPEHRAMCPACGRFCGCCDE